MASLCRYHDENRAHPCHETVLLFVVIADRGEQPGTRSRVLDLEGLRGLGPHLGATQPGLSRKDDRLCSGFNLQLREDFRDVIPQGVWTDVQTAGDLCIAPVSYTHLRAHETKANLVCR